MRLNWVFSIILAGVPLIAYGDQGHDQELDVGQETIHLNQTVSLPVRSIPGRSVDVAGISPGMPAQVVLEQLRRTYGDKNVSTVELPAEFISYNAVVVSSPAYIHEADVEAKDFYMEVGFSSPASGNVVVSVSMHHGDFGVNTTPFPDGTALHLASVLQDKYGQVSDSQTNDDTSLANDPRKRIDLAWDISDTGTTMPCRLFDYAENDDCVPDVYPDHLPDIVDAEKTARDRNIAISIQAYIFYNDYLDNSATENNIDEWAVSFIDYDYIAKDMRAYGSQLQAVAIEANKNTSNKFPSFECGNDVYDDNQIGQNIGFEPILSFDEANMTAIVSVGRSFSPSIVKSKMSQSEDGDFKEYRWTAIFSDADSKNSYKENYAFLIPSNTRLEEVADEGKLFISEGRFQGQESEESDCQRRVDDEAMK